MQAFCGFNRRRNPNYLGVAQMVERYLGVVEVARSNRVTQTKHGKSERICRVFCFLLYFIFYCVFVFMPPCLGPVPDLMYALHTKSCLLLGGRARRA